MPVPGRARFSMPAILAPGSGSNCVGVLSLPAQPMDCVAILDQCKDILEYRNMPHIWQQDAACDHCGGPLPCPCNLDCIRVAGGFVGIEDSGNIVAGCPTHQCANLATDLDMTMAAAEVDGTLIDCRWEAIVSLCNGAVLISVWVYFDEVTDKWRLVVNRDTTPSLLPENVLAEYTAATWDCLSDVVFTKESFASSSLDASDLCISWPETVTLRPCDTNQGCLSTFEDQTQVCLFFNNDTTCGSFLQLDQPQLQLDGPLGGPWSALYVNACNGKLYNVFVYLVDGVMKVSFDAQDGTNYITGTLTNTALGGADVSCCLAVDRSTWTASVGTLDDFCGSCGSFALGLMVCPGSCTIPTTCGCDVPRALCGVLHLPWGDIQGTMNYGYWYFHDPLNPPTLQGPGWYAGIEVDHLPTPNGTINFIDLWLTCTNGVFAVNAQVYYDERGIDQFDVVGFGATSLDAIDCGPPFKLHMPGDTSSHSFLGTTVDITAGECGPTSSSSEGSNSSQGDGGGGSAIRTSLGTMSGLNNTFSLSVTVEAGDLLIVNVGQSDNFGLPSITFSIDPLSIAIAAHGSAYWGSIWSRDVTSTTTANVTVTFPGVVRAMISIVKVSGLTNNAPDRTKDGSGGVTQMDTGAASPTTAANEYVQGLFVYGYTGTPTVTWENSFIDGGQGIDFGNDHTTEGYRTLGSAGVSPDAAVSGPPPPDSNWVGVLATFS